jgi:hypothetical protein
VVLALRKFPSRENRVSQWDGAANEGQLVGAGLDRALLETAALAGVTLRGGTAVGGVVVGGLVVAGVALLAHDKSPVVAKLNCVERERRWPHSVEGRNPQAIPKVHGAYQNLCELPCRLQVR